MDYKFDAPVEYWYTVSDLHLEQYQDEARWWSVLPDPNPEAGLILAGDITTWHRGAALKANSPVMRLLTALSKRHRLVAYSPGNHEYWKGSVGHYYDEKLRRLLREADLDNVFLLNNDALYLPGLRLLGSTLWADLDRANPLLLAQLSSGPGRRSPMNDYNYSRFSDDKRAFPRYSPYHTLELHKRSREYLTQQLAQPFKGKTWVATHHLPSRRFIEPQHQGSWLEGAYASDLDHLVEQADLWAFGHSHQVLDIIDPITGTRIVSNAAGYIGEVDARFDRNKTLALTIQSEGGER